MGYRNDEEGCVFIIFVAWLLGVVISLALIGALIYIAYHFITKFW